MMKSGLRVVDAMTVRPVVATPRQSIRDVAVIMEKQDVSTMLIKRGEELLGIVTEHDIVARGVLEGYDMNTTPVNRIMTQDIVTTSPGMDLFDVILLMKDAEVRTLPVLDHGHLVGFVTEKDILKLQPDLFEILVESIELREEEQKMRRRDHRRDMAVFEDD